MTATQQQVKYAVGAFDVGVVRTRRLSPTFLRVTFGGLSLLDFLDHGVSGPRDLRIKLIFPVSHREPFRLGDLSDGWYQRWRALDPDVRGVMRTYTVRRCRLEGPEPEVDVDFALHGDDPGSSGPASSWVSAARPGDRLTMIGPTAGGEGYGGIEWRPPSPSVQSPTRLLLVGDETAVPAVCSILESLRPGYVGHAVLEVPSPQDFLDIRTRADVEVRWLARHGRTRGEPLDTEVRCVVQELTTGTAPRIVAPDNDPEDLIWERSDADATTGDRAVYVWVAGEAGMVRAVRRHLVNDAGLDKRCVAFMGYWRRGRSEGE